MKYVNSPAYRPNSFGRMALPSVFDGFDVTNIYLKPYNWPSLKKNTPQRQICTFCVSQCGKLEV